VIDDGLAVYFRGEGIVVAIIVGVLIAGRWV
jgi:hypothetical protein